MPYFLCRLATEDGQYLAQSFLASSPEDCRRHFEGQGFCVLSVQKDWKKKALPSLPFEKKIKDKDFIMFNQELVALLRAGYPILKSLELIAGRTKNVYLKELLQKIESGVRGSQADGVRAVIAAEPRLDLAEIRDDLAGTPRVAVATKVESPVTA